LDTRLGKLAFGIAVAGFAASVIVHATALLTAQALPPAVIYALLAGVAVSGLLASMVAPRPASPPPWTRAELRHAVLDAVPFWMRATFYALLGYAAVQFGMLVVGLPAQSSAFSSPLGVRLFSSYGLVLYFSVLAVCVAARRRPRAAGWRRA
jgi:hypothetical protein